jgi:methionyl aminopeptidase
MELKTPAEIRVMADGGRILAQIIDDTCARVAPGVSLRELNDYAHTRMREAGGTPSFLNYHPHGAPEPFPASICASVNNVVVHGIPDDYRIHEGDIVKLDFGLLYNGFHTDSARTIPIGRVSAQASALIGATQRALEAGIRAARPGNTLGDIGHAIARTVRADGFAVVDELTGHGIGRTLHEDPYVYNTGTPGRGPRLVPGMVLAIEPMTAAGSSRVRQKSDGSFVTADGSWSAHFEHTIAITEAGCDVLTDIGRARA